METYPTNLKLTSREEMERLLSFRAIQNRIDDDDGGSSTEEEVLDDFIIEASDTVYAYTQHLYNELDLAGNRWVRFRATVIACYLLSRRRGDPGLYEDLYQHNLDMLKQIKEMEMRIPRLGYKDDLTPAMSNLRVDDRFRLSKIRVESQISNGGTSGRQALSPEVWGEYYR